MPRWFRYSEVAQSRPIFSHLIGAPAYDELLAYMAQHQHRYKPRTRHPAG